MDYQKIYEQIVNRALSRGRPNDEYDRHHIVPRSMGGPDYESNLVNLTLREHFICHLILARMYGGPMIRAAFMMSSNRKYNNRQYASLRTSYIVNFMQGDMNPSRRFPWTDEQKKKIGIVAKGRKWVNNGVDSCMAKDEKLNELLANGWVHGRLLTPTLIEGTKKGGKATGGHNKGIPMSEEQKEKCRQSFFMSGREAYNKGIPMSEEQKEKMKPYFLAMKGKPSRRKGIPLSEEQKEKCKDNFFKKGHVPHNKKAVD